MLFSRRLFSQWMQLWHFKLVWMIAHGRFAGNLRLQVPGKVVGESRRSVKTLKHPSSLYILRSKILSQWAEVIHSAHGTLGREWQEARKLKWETCSSHAFKLARRIKYCCLTSVHVRLCAFWPFPRRLLNFCQDGLSLLHRLFWRYMTSS